MAGFIFGAIAGMASGVVITALIFIRSSGWKK
jgi:hypothetical protein